MRDPRYKVEILGTQTKDMIFVTAVRKITYNEYFVIDRLTHQPVSEVFLVYAQMDVGQFWTHPVCRISHLLNVEDESYLKEVINYCL